MITYHHNIVQGSDEWFASRCGMLTASEMKLIVTPTLKIADNEKTRTHLYELLAQRITQYVEPQYVSDSMLRGKEDELDAKIIYNEKYAPVEDVGFVTNDRWGFTIGFSPDGLIGEDGFIECKSRCQKYQIQTITEMKMPDDFMLQVQTGYLVTERKWCDFISYSGGLPMTTILIPPDKISQEAILDAATSFEKKLDEKKKIYLENISNKNNRMIPTERKKQEEITI